MVRIIRPVFGKPCHECGEQVPHARIKVLEADAAAKGLPLMAFDLICADCKSLRENEERRFRRAERDRSIIMIQR